MPYTTEDRPPAGTACSVCQSAGHFCAANLYVGQTDLGICIPCREGRDCERFIAQRSQEEAEESATCTPPPPAPTKQPRFTLTTERNFLYGQFKAQIHFLQTIDDDNIAIVRKELNKAPAESVFIEYRLDGKWAILLDLPIFHSDRDVARAIAREISAGCEEARTQIYRKPATTSRSQGEVHKVDGRGRKPGVNYKTQERQQAAELLVEGKSIRQVSATTGLAANTVRKVKSITPEAPAKANNGGAPEHKPKEATMSEPSNNPELFPEFFDQIQNVTALLDEAAGTLMLAQDALPSDVHPLIVGLVKQMPKTGMTWPSGRRTIWCNALFAILSLLYRDTGTDDEQFWYYSVGRDWLGDTPAPKGAKSA